MRPRLFQNFLVLAAVSVLALLPVPRALAGYEQIDWIADGEGPLSLAAVAFPGEGLILAVASSGENAVKIYPKNAHVARSTYAVGSNPRAIVAADLNADGRVDLVVANRGSNDISILLALPQVPRSDLFFEPALNHSVGAEPVSLVIGDLSGDGIPDVAVANSGSGSVSILLGLGSGSFGAGVEYPAGPSPSSLALGDFDGNGHLDLVATNPSTNAVSILLGAGDGTFDAPVVFPAGPSPASVAVGDLDGDGFLDLAVANRDSAEVSVLRGRGDGTMRARRAYSVGLQPSFVALHDESGDGRLDLLVVNTGSNTFSVLLNGNGSFQPASSYPSLYGPVALAFGDFVTVGQPVLAVANTFFHNVNFFRTDGMAVSCQGPVNHGVGNDPAGVVATDLNGDGKPDLAVANRGSDDVSILIGSGLGAFEQQTSYAAGAGPTSITAGDFNGDGKRDLAVGNGLSLSDDDVSVFMGNGDGTLQPPVSYAAGAGARSIVVADFNLDGKQDLAVANHDSDDVSLLLGNGDGTFSAAASHALGAHANAVAVGDFNKDGKADLAVVLDTSTHSLGILLGKGDGSFQPMAFTPFAGISHSVAVADFDRNGNQDLALANVADGSLSLLKGRDDGTFAWDWHWSSWQFQPGSPSGIAPEAVAAGDVNGDGASDLVIANMGSDNFFIHQGIGSAAVFPFAQFSLFSAAGRAPSFATLSDVDADGREDVVVANGAQGDVSILLTSCERPTTTTLTSSANPSTYGQTVDLTARVTSNGMPVGSMQNITYWEGALWVASWYYTLPGEARWPTNYLYGGSHRLTAKFPGDLNYASSASAEMVQVVQAQTDLSITLTDGQTVAAPSSPVTYSLVVSNRGPHPVAGVVVSDVLPPEIVGVAWTRSSGGGPSAPMGSGNLSQTIDLAVGATVTYTGTGTIRASATGTVTNTASLTLPPGVTDMNLANNSASDSDSLAQADLMITKSDGQASALIDGPVTYTITISNAGPDTARAETVTDALPAAIQGATWTCAGMGGGTCAASGTGSIHDAVALPAGASVTYTLTGMISPAATGTVTNTATVTHASITDTQTGNNSATDTDTLVVAHADLSITKTDGQPIVSSGGPITYTITAANAGPDPASNAVITDTVPVVIEGVTWVCAGAGGATCAESGTGNLSETVTLPMSGSVTYTLRGTVDAWSSSNMLTNSASITAPASAVDPEPANNVASDTDTVTGCYNTKSEIEPDGRRESIVAPAGGELWFTVLGRPGSTYSVEVDPESGSTSLPATLTIFGSEDGCTASTLVTRDTSSIEPRVAGGIRASYQATGPYFFSFNKARLANHSGAPLPVTISWSETTMYSASWSDNGTFDTFYSFQNTTSAPIQGTLTLRDAAGGVASVYAFTVPAGGLVTTNTVALEVVRDRTGTATLAHDGPPGAISATAAIANFTTMPAFVQPVKFEAVREAR